MAFALKALLVAALLALSGCYSTQVPSHASHSSERSSAKVERSPNYSMYTVRRGDTLYSIGKRFGVDHKLLARRNYIRWPYTIFVGQQLSLTRTAPKSEFTPSAAESGAYSAAPTPAPQAKAPVAVRPAAKGGVTAKAPAKSSQTASYSTPAVNGAKSVRLQWPLKGKVSSGFGRRGSRMHDGIDISASEGTPVYAAAAGEVVYSDQRLSGYGKLIIVRHSQDMFTAYAHNQRNLVSKGDKIRQGDVIARVGKTGRASGPHLHFEVRRGPTPVDPLAYLPRR